MTRTASAMEGRMSRIEAQLESIGRELRDLRRISQDTLAQARATNGRVSSHDVDLARIQEREQARAVAAREESQRRDRRDRWALWALGVLATSILASLGWIITAIT